MSYKTSLKEKARKRALDWWHEGTQIVIIPRLATEISLPRWTEIIEAPEEVKNRGYAICDVCGKNIPAGEGYLLDGEDYKTMIYPAFFGNLPESLMQARIWTIIQGTFITDIPELKAKVNLCRIMLAGAFVRADRAE